MSDLPEHVVRYRDVNVEHNIYGSPLIIVSEKGYLSLSKLLIKKGADVNYMTPLDDSSRYFGSWPGVCALSLASLRGHTLIVEELLNRSADINAFKGDPFYAPLNMASRGCHADVVSMLLKSGVSIPDGFDGCDEAMKIISRAKAERLLKK